MLDHETAASDALCASQDVEKLMDCAVLEDMGTNMTPLREIGESVSILSDGDELRIEQTDLV